MLWKKFLTAVMAAASLTSMAAELTFKDGDVVAFFGDSFMIGAMNPQNGFAALMRDALKDEGVNITPLAAGVAKDTSDGAADRVQSDVIDRKANTVIVNCGVYDLEDDISMSSYKRNMTKIINACGDAGLKVIVLTPGRPYEESRSGNVKILSYIKVLKQLAESGSTREFTLIDMNAAMERAVEQKQRIYADGTLLNPAGNMLYAEEILSALGMDAAKLKKCIADWRSNPNRTRL